ncbi:MAG TPA: hypothetical protein PLH45_05355 [Synergistales bacterium]|nr:MAG: Terminase-like family protein [Deltaproteobacteria bacterium ADurb.Bin072]HNQ86738.1 hypothetical protein [Deltaproteobacteria bacterium]HPA76794.1 hypothetical protein [Deltaproteobacteria bacterium]HQQ10840.1 hypothetical protein [Synergistales bacterium]
MAGWDDAPHLTDEMKSDLLLSIPPYQREARSKGRPMLGVGAIYPIAEEDITCRPFEIPKTWGRTFGFDVGWQYTAAVWGAYDREGDIVYLYSEYKRGNVEPPIHAAALRTRGSWIPGVIDPASAGSSQVDGRKLITIYRDEMKLDIRAANNAVAAGIEAVWYRLTTGRLLVFNTLVNWLGEFRTYHRDEDGDIVKSNDHLMDATRYLVMSGLQYGISEEQANQLIRAPRDRYGRPLSAQRIVGDPSVGY